MTVRRAIRIEQQLQASEAYEAAMSAAGNSHTQLQSTLTRGIYSSLYKQQQHEPYLPLEVVGKPSDRAHLRRQDS